MTASEDPVQKALNDFSGLLSTTTKIIAPAPGGGGTVLPSGAQPCDNDSIAGLKRELAKIKDSTPSSDDLDRWIAEANGLLGIQVAHKDIATQRKALNDQITKAKDARTAVDDKLKLTPSCVLTADQSAVLNGYQAKIDAASQVVKSMDGLITLLVGFEKQLWRSSESPSDDLVFATVESNPAQIQTVQLTLQPTKYSMDATGVISVAKDPAITRKFAIRRHRRLVPEYGLAGIYNNLRYPKYSVSTNEDGSNVVARSFDSGNVTAAATLNLMCNCFGGSGLYPGIQFGISKAKDYPGLLLGGMLRFAGETHIALAAGTIVTWYKDLNQLKVGGPVSSDDALKNDLKLRMSRAAFYLGAQYTF